MYMDHLGASCHDAPSSPAVQVSWLSHTNQSSPVITQGVSHETFRLV